MNDSVLKKTGLALAILIAGASMASAALITYVDATTGNTTFGDGSAFAPVGTTENDGNWGSRPFSNGGEIYTSNSAEDSPELRTTISGLIDGQQYNLYAYYWIADYPTPTGNAPWDIAAGLTSGDTTTYAWDGGTPAAESDFDATVLVVESNRQLFQINLGTVTLSGATSVNIFIDDNPGNEYRTWYDGVGYAPIPTTPLAPVWSEDPITNTTARANHAFTGTLAGLATDPNMDTVTYSKGSSEPTWLEVAADGTLSGMPTAVGTDTFTVVASDGNLTTPATLVVVVSAPSAPVWSEDPIDGGSANVSVVYSNTVAGRATDPDGDAISYSKDAGDPPWLNVEPDGTLWGTPASGDEGLNVFTVIATDVNGDTPATLNIQVVDFTAFTPITVVNFSFEEPGTGDNRDWSTIPGWDWDSAGSASVGVTDGYTSTDGSYEAYFGDTSAISQLTGHVIASGDLFSLVFDVRDNWNGDTLVAELYYDDDGTPEVIQAFSITPVNTDYEEVTFTTTLPATPAMAGKTLGVRFGVDDGWLHIDTIRLGVSGKPADAVTDLVVYAPVSGGTGIVLAWTGENGGTYGVETNSNLVIADWQTFMTGIPGNGGTITVTNTMGPDQTFYRVITE